MSRRFFVGGGGGGSPLPLPLSLLPCSSQRSSLLPAAASAAVRAAMYEHAAAGRGEEKESVNLILGAAPPHQPQRLLLAPPSRGQKSVDLCRDVPR